MGVSIQKNSQVIEYVTKCPCWIGNEITNNCFNLHFVCEEIIENKKKVFRQQSYCAQRGWV